MSHGGHTLQDSEKTPASSSAPQIQIQTRVPAVRHHAPRKPPIPLRLADIPTPPLRAPERAHALCVPRAPILHLAHERSERRERRGEGEMRAFVCARAGPGVEDEAAEGEPCVLSGGRGVLEGGEWEVGVRERRLEPEDLELWARDDVRGSGARGA